MRVAITYAVVAWLIIQIAVSTFEGFGIPVWAFRFVVIMLGLFFPVAIILAWAFELTPDGIKTTKVADKERDDAPVSKKQQRKRNWFTFLFGAAVPTVIFGTLAIYFYATRSSGDGEAEIGEKSIAVLPLENMSPDPDNAFFADGVQEDILTNLSRINEIGLVISRSSTLKYRNPDRNLKQVGEELGVRYIVEGSVRRAKDQVRITVQLIDARTDDHLWAQNYDRPLENIFTIQSAIAKEIAGKLQAILSPKDVAEIEYRPTENQEAYDYYLRARNMEGSGLGAPMAIVENLELAVSHDPNFAEAWAQLSGQTIFQWHVRGRREPELHKRAYAALEKAKLLNSEIADIPYNLSKFFLHEHYDVETSISLMLKAVAIDPSAKLGHLLLVNRYLRSGRLAEAQHHGEAAVRMDPLLFLANRQWTNTYVRRRMWNKAFALIQKNATRSDDARWTRKFASTQYHQTGDKNAFGKAIELLPGYKEDSYLQLARSLIARDYLNALLHVVDLEGPSWFGFHENSDFSIDLRLVASLIRFVQDDSSKWLAEIGIASAYYEETIEVDSMTLPTNWSQLSICYALEGKTDQL